MPFILSVKNKMYAAVPNDEILDNVYNELLNVKEIPDGDIQIKRISSAVYSTLVSIMCDPDYQGDTP